MQVKPKSVSELRQRSRIAALHSWSNPGRFLPKTRTPILLLAVCRISSVIANRLLSSSPPSAARRCACPTLQPAVVSSYKIPGTPESVHRTASPPVCDARSPQPRREEPGDGPHRSPHRVAAGPPSHRSSPLQEPALQPAQPTPHPPYPAWRPAPSMPSPAVPASRCGSEFPEPCSPLQPGVAPRPQSSGASGDRSGQRQPPRTPYFRPRCECPLRQLRQPSRSGGQPHREPSGNCPPQTEPQARKPDGAHPLLPVEPTP